MQNKLSDIIDLVWDLADLSLEYGHLSSIESGDHQKIMEICGLKCVFHGNDIKRILANDIDLHLMWCDMQTANDNDGVESICGLNIAEIFPESATFLIGDMAVLKKWHSDLNILRGALVA